MFIPQSTGMVQSGYNYGPPGTWDIDDLVLTNEVSDNIVGEITGVCFSYDGSKMYTCFLWNNEDFYIDQFTLSTPWDLSDYSYEKRQLFPSVDTDWRKSITIGGNGKTLLIASRSRAYRCTLSTPWEIDTASSAVEISTYIRTGHQSFYSDPYFSDQALIFRATSNRDEVVLFYLYDFYSDFIPSSARLEDIIRPWGVWMKPDGTRFFVSYFDENNNFNHTFHQFDVTTPYTFSGINNVKDVIPANNGSGSDQCSMYISPTGHRLYLANRTSGSPKVIEYSMEA